MGPAGVLVRRATPYGAWVPVAICVDGEVVGFAEWAYDATDASHCIGGVVIDAGRQGRGYGRAGMRALVAYLRQRPGCEVIALSVHEENPARALYRSLGFVETGERDEDELVMVLPPNP